VICILHDLKNLFFKRKKRKKESIYIRRRGWLQRSNAIKEGFVQRALCLWRNFFAAKGQGLL